MDHFELCRQLWQQKAVVDEVKAKYDAEAAKFEAIKRDVLKSLDSNQITKQHIPEHGTVYVQTRFSIETPKTLDAKRELFGYIEREKGPEVLLGLQSIHSATLNKFHESESELAATRGDFRWSLPGIGEPKSFKTVNMRKG